MWGSYAIHVNGKAVFGFLQTPTPAAARGPLATWHLFPKSSEFSLIASNLIHARQCTEAAYIESVRCRWKDMKDMELHEA